MGQLHAGGGTSGLSDMPTSPPSTQDVLRTVVITGYCFRRVLFLLGAAGARFQIFHPAPEYLRFLLYTHAGKEGMGSGPYVSAVRALLKVYFLRFHAEPFKLLHSAGHFSLIP